MYNGVFPWKRTFFVVQDSHLEEANANDLSSLVKGAWLLQNSTYGFKRPFLYLKVERLTAIKGLALLSVVVLIAETNGCLKKISSVLLQVQKLFVKKTITDQVNDLCSPKLNVSTQREIRA